MKKFNNRLRLNAMKAERKKLSARGDEKKNLSSVLKNTRSNVLD